jgi:hypothetical protein
MNRICIPSTDIVAREIEGEIVIVPLVAGVGDLEDELYTLNETGRAIWNRLDGTKTLGAIAEELVSEFDGPIEEIERDVAGLADELIRRRILVQLNV